MSWLRKDTIAERRALQLARAGDHVGAFAHVTPVPLVVRSRLGLHLSVVEDQSTRTRAERRCVALAHAELGDVERALRAAYDVSFAWRPAMRARLVASLARWAPVEARNFAGRSASLLDCALALRSCAPTEAERLFDMSREGQTADRFAVEAILAALRGHHRHAREAANRMFAMFGQLPPLNASIDTPLSLEAFEFGGVDRPTSWTNRGPDVSIIMPVRNCASSVGTAVRSALGQTWRALELVVIDDASEDGTVENVRAAIANDPRGRVVRRTTRGGTYTARNAGLALATGEFVTFHDGDDWSHPERIARGMLPLLAEPGVMATQSRLVRLGADGLFVAPRVFPFVRANPSSLLFRRKQVVEALGGFDCVPFGADEEFSARIVACFGPGSVRRISNLLAVCMESQSSLTGSAQTGVRSLQGNRDRIAYREAWHRRHLLAHRCLCRGDVQVARPWRIDVRFGANVSVPLAKAC